MIAPIGAIHHSFGIVCDVSPLWIGPSNSNNGLSFCIDSPSSNMGFSPPAFIEVCAWALGENSPDLDTPKISIVSIKTIIPMLTRLFFKNLRENLSIKLNHSPFCFLNLDIHWCLKNHTYTVIIPFFPSESYRALKTLY